MFFTDSAVRVKPGVPPWCSALTKKYNLKHKLGFSNFKVQKKGVHSLGVLSQFALYCLHLYCTYSLILLNNLWSGT